MQTQHKVEIDKRDGKVWTNWKGYGSGDRHRSDGSIFIG
jgi:hypothetical protein